MGVFSIVADHVLAGKGKATPSAKLNIAGIGLGAIGYENLEKCDTENIVALCDVDWNLAAVAAERWPKARRYRDYRCMLDQEKDLDAVVVSTPDHTHAVITAEVMRHGMHVYTEMPLAHDVWEARRLAEIATETGVVTQMGNRFHSGPEIRLACEWTWSGKLGAVRKVECWTNRPQWLQGMAAPPKACPLPPSLQWDLWIGPAPMKPYSSAYHPYDWRGWRDFGTGALGAMGCFLIDGPFWALKLADANRFTVEADSTGMTSHTWPNASTIRYHFPARGDMPPVLLVWRDGGRKPPHPEEWPDSRETVGSNGVHFVGDECTMVLGPVVSGTYHGEAGPRLLPESKMQGGAPQRIPRVEKSTNWHADDRHQREWIRACKRGQQPCSSFDYSGPLTEMVLLGNVALAAGKRIQWDRKAMNIASASDANKLLRRQYRKGWSL